MRIRRKIVFSPHIRKNAKTNIHPLRMRVSYAGNRIELPTGCYVNPRHFDKDINRMIGGKEAERINAELTELEGRVNDIFSRFELIEKRLPDPGEIKSAFQPKKEKVSTQTDIFDTFDLFTRSMGRQNGWTPDTFRKFRNVKSHLQNFDKKLSMESLSEERLSDFLQYMFSLNLMNSTVAKNISYVRWFLRWSYRRGIYKGRLHETFRPRIKGTDGNNKVVIFLTWEELMALYNMQLPEETSIHKKHLSHTLDVFLFCCFTGLRHSDVYKLKKTDIGNNYISLVTQKTTEYLKIELNKYSKAILNKYKDANIRGGKALPVYANQKMNDHLKIICKKAGLNDPVRIVYWQGNRRKDRILPKYELITTHCGRRTFIVNSLYLGIPAEVIMKWTGHADYAAMKPYIAIVDDLKAKEMKKFDR